jgi:NAD(P)-dependent dehydrogenase (short-subunit alcohol dehydrogenase family)
VADVRVPLLLVWSKNARGLPGHDGFALRDPSGWSKLPPKFADACVTPQLGRAMSGRRYRHLANAYLWLACDAASFVTVTALSVDGGGVPGT